jgi:phosphomannomutase
MQNTNHKFSPEVLRKYDIRGTVGLTITEIDAYYIGKSFTTLMHQRAITGRVVLAYDGRISSPSLFEALKKGINDGGFAVVNIGLAATPLLYFSTATLENIGGGIMITGYHNPANQNGFKMVLCGKPLYDQDILKLAEISAAGSFAQIIQNNECTDIDIGPSYIEQILKMHPNLGETKAVWDPGNGVVGAHLSNLISKLPGKHSAINLEVDGSFPNHHPNPSEIANLQQLIAEVKTTQSDLGIAFDGDGDRLGVVTKKGQVIWGDTLLLLLSEDLLKRHPGAKIIADVKTGNWVLNKISELGGSPIMWKTGHSFIKIKMKETGALLAGEMSGHLFFAENYYGFDDAILAAVKLLEILSLNNIDLDDYLASMPDLFGTPEVSINYPEKEKFTVIEKLKNKLQELNINFIDLDGLRVNLDNGWWLIRASNTEAKLIFRAESHSKELLISILENVKALTTDLGIVLPENCIKE